LSRAILCILRGSWFESLSHHPFAILFLGALVLIAMAAVFPEAWGKAMGHVAERVERRTGLSWIVLGAVSVFGFLRMISWL